MRYKVILSDGTVAVVEASTYAVDDSGPISVGFYVEGINVFTAINPRAWGEDQRFKIHACDPTRVID